MNEQTERLSAEEVAEFADFPYTPTERRLAREVQELRRHGGIEHLLELEAENERLTKELAHAKEQWEFRAELAFVMKGERDDALAELAAMRYAPTTSGDGQGMNHADLLRRYIAHVRACEGVAFLYDDQRWESAREGITFTDDEWALLCSLESQRPGT